MVGDYSDQRGGPSKLHQLVLHKSEIAFLNKHWKGISNVP